MKTAAVTEGNSPRLWPAVVIVTVVWLVLLSPRVIEMAAAMRFSLLIFAPQIAAACAFIWWLFFSRVSWKTRFIGLGICLVTAVAMKLLADKSMSFILMIWGIPSALLGMVLGFLALQRWREILSPWTPAVGLILGAAIWLFVRLEGVTGGRDGEYNFRWAASREELFLAELAQRKPAALQPAPMTSAESPTEEVASEMRSPWPRFRGPMGNSIVGEEALQLDWKQPPPRLWQKRLGPAWSSFIAIDQHIVTQEQRGEEEAIVCYELLTGNEVWSHGDPQRFDETVSGPGPRATPTYHNGRIFAFGGNGLLTCVDAKTGNRIWQRDLPKDLNVKPPMWGYSSSPAIFAQQVIVFPQANTASVVACDLETGATRWQFGEGLKMYSSPQVVEIAGVEQLLVFASQGLTALSAEGKLLWQFDWKLDNATASVQPQLVGENRLLLGYGDVGMKMIEVDHKDEEWSTREIWMTTKLKPDFNDFVVQNGFIYGFDGRILACVDLATGQQRWKGGRYGTGQLLLLAEHKQLLVVSDKGEVALVAAAPEAFHELGKFPAISGKTWNHPLLVDGKLVLRNGEEMACYDLSPAVGK